MYVYEWIWGKTLEIQYNKYTFTYYKVKNSKSLKNDFHFKIQNCINNIII